MRFKDRLIASITAFLIAISPLQGSLIVFADEVDVDADLPVEETLPDAFKETETRGRTEDGRSWNDYRTNEGSGTMADPEDTVPAETAEEIVTASSAEERQTIVTASSSEEYFGLISDFPDMERVIVDTSEELSYLEVQYGIFYDGTYILGFEDHEELLKALKVLDDAGHGYAVDGTVGICGDDIEPADSVQTDKAARVKVALIDTGSDLADESYSVTGDDPGDHNGHGTAVSSYILNETGGVSIISIKAIGDNGRGNMSDVYAAVQMADELECDYILMAVSIRNTGDYDAFVTLIENTKATVVASAGNNGTDASKYLPAGIENVITVGALAEDGTLAENSNYGNCVDYYVYAGSTSEAAARALGIIIDGRSSELATEYMEASSSGNEYHLALRADDDDVYFDTDATKAGQNIIVYAEPVITNSDVFVGGSDSLRNMFYYDKDLNPAGHLDDTYYYSDALYCLQDWKWGPNGYLHPDGSSYSYINGSYPYTSGSVSNEIKMVQAACAFGPGGALYEYGLDWWKTHDPGHEAVYLKYPQRSMYLITHYALCYSFDPDGYASHGSPGNAMFDSLLKEYCDYLFDIRTGAEKIPGITLSSWWCEIYGCTMSDAVAEPDRYQNVCQGDVRVKGYVPVTVAKSPSVPVDEGYLGLGGTEYRLYRNEKAAKNMDEFYWLATFEMRDDGTTDDVFRTIEGTKVYLRETVPAEGYVLDDSIYEIVIGDDGEITVSTVSGSGEVSVTNGSTISIIRVKDTPDKAVFSLEKRIEQNSNLLAGRSYSFELWDDTSNVRAATGRASVPSEATAASSVPVVWSDAADGYRSIDGNRLELISGHSYQVMETTLSIDGLELEVPDGWIKGTLHGKECFFQTFTPDAGKVYPLTITNKAPVQIRLTKISADSSVTDGNSAYSLAGAEYVLSTDVSFADKATAGTFIMKKDGTSDSVVTVVRGGTYYLKEITAGTGYKLDKSVYKIVIDDLGSADISTYSGAGKASVTNGDTVVICVKDQPRMTEFSLSKKLGKNADILADLTYGFELWDKTSGILVASGKASVPLKAATTAVPVVWSDVADGYSLLGGNRIEIIPGHSYQIRETTQTVNGIKLETPKGWKSGNGYFYIDFKAGTDKNCVFTVTNEAPPARFMLYKKTDTVSSVLTGRSYDFELWDKTASVRAASGVADVPSGSSPETSTPVVWNDVAGGCSLLADNQLEIIPGHEYQIRETTTSVDGRNLVCPAGWKTGSGYFYQDFTSVSGQIHQFTVTNNTSVLLTLTKVSSDKSVTNGNNAYSLAGAEYVLSKDPSFADKNVAGTFRMKSDGTSDTTVTVVRGATYYLKEKSAGAGYALDDSVYKIVIDAKGNASVSTYSGRGKAYVTNGDPVTVSVSDKPEMTEFSIVKHSSDPLVSGTMPNSIYDLEGAVYGLYTDAGCTAEVKEFHMKSSGTTDDSFKTAYGKTYYLKEIKAGKGFELDKKIYKITVGSGGNISVNNGASADNSGLVKIAVVTDVPKTAKFSLNKKLGTNASLLAGKEYVFELWDTDSGRKAAKGKVAVPEGATSSGSYPVVWSDLAAGYSAGADNKINIIPGRSYRIREITVSVDGRDLICPDGWNQHEDGYFYLDFTADSIKTYSFTVTNSTDVRLSITKASADPAVSGGNGSYDLAGAEYLLSSDAAFTDRIGTFTVKSDGTADRDLSITCGSEYYLKEISAAKGFMLDSSVYKIVIGDKGDAVVSTYSGSGTATVTNGDPILINVKDRPGTTLISLVKSSGNRSMTDDNDCYSLAGTEYSLFRNSDDASSDRNAVAVFTVESDGNTTGKYKTAFGKTYYLKETKAGKGYMTDDKIYTVTVDGKGKVSVDNGAAVTFADGVYRIGLSDVPMSAPVSWSILKHDANGWNNITERSLSGAVFTVEYFDRTDIASEDDADKLADAEPKVTVRLVSGQVSETDGRITISPDTLAVADATGYFKSFSQLDQLPLGTYRVTETSAPDGYAVARKPVVFYITDVHGSAETGVAGDASFYNIASGSEVIMKEPALVGFYAPSKTASGAAALISGLHSLEGTRYGIYYKANGKLVCTVDFNASGAVSNVEYASGIVPSKTWKTGDKVIELAAGEYYAKELNAGKWFFIDGAAHVFTVNAGKTSEMEFTDKPVIPGISTSATDADTGTHYLSFKDRVTVKDDVSYEGLLPDGEYELKGTLYDAVTGEIYKDPDGNTYTKTVLFTPGHDGSAESDGTAYGKVTVVFDDVYIPLEKISLVVFEELYKDGILIASHRELNDKGQTVTRRVPEIGTSATDASSGTRVFAFKERVSVNDVVTYANLNAGETYYIKGTLYDAGTGTIFEDSEGNTYTAAVEFTASKENGTETVTFEDVLIPYTETTLVVFEELYEKSTDNRIAVHSDLKDKGQTLRRPEIHTTASDKNTGTHYLSYTERVTVTDRVEYSNLIPGEEYTVSGSLYDAATGKIYKDPEGRSYTKTVRFTPAAADSDITDGVAYGAIEVSFEDVYVPLEKTELVVFEKMYLTESNTLVASHADLNDKGQTVERLVPEIRTTAEDAVTRSHTLALGEKVSVRDTVSYTDLNPGETYFVTGTLYDADTGRVYTDREGTTYTETVEFTAKEPDGSVVITFTDVLIPYEKTTIVVFEDLHEKTTGIKIATHADLKDEDQTVRRPEIHTTATDADTGTHFSSFRENVNINDSVEYENLTAGEEYVISGTLYDTDTGEVYEDADGNTYFSSVSFVPESSDGSVVVPFDDVQVPLEGKTVVVFEKLYEKKSNTVIAVHEDISYEGQSVERRVPEIHTTATDAVTGTHTFTYEEKVTLRDEVAYSNLNAGETYYLTGTLYNAETGKVYTDRFGKTYEATIEFTAAASDGIETVEFKDVPVPFEKTTIVVFEELYEKTTGTLIAVHADLKDENQTVRRPEVSTTATVLNAKEIWLGTTEVTDITITDQIYYSGFESGRTYRAEAVLYKDDGTMLSEGMPYTGSVVFVPVTADGEVTVEITFPSEGLEEGDRIVVFEKIYDVATAEELSSAERTEDILIAKHEDLSDEDQTVTIHFRPMTGGIVPSYTVAGNVIATAASVIAGAWFIISRRKRYGGESS